MQTEFTLVLDQQRRSWNRFVLQIAAVLIIVLGCWYYVGLLDMTRLSEGIPSLFSLIGEMFRPISARRSRGSNLCWIPWP